MRLARARWASAALVVGLVSWADLLEPVDRALLDWRSALVSRPATGRVVVVGIDAESSAKLGRWPWPRSVHAALVEQLRAAGADRVGFDIDLSAAGDPTADRALASALAAAGPDRVALAGYLQHQPMADRPPRVVETVPSAQLLPHAALASVNIVPDVDGLARAYPAGAVLAGGWRPSLALWAIGAGDRRTGLRLDPAIDVASIPYFSYLDVVSGAADPSWLAGRAVLVGAVDPALGDMVATPRWRALPGVLVHALAAETLLQDRDLVWLGGGSLGPALALLLLVLGPRLELRPLARVVGSGLALVLASAALATALQIGWSRTFAIGPIGLAWGVAATMVTARDRARLRAARQEAALDAERRRRLVEGIVSSSFDGILTVTDDSRVLTANPAASAMLGLPAEQMVGRPLGAVDPALPAALVQGPGASERRGEIRLDRPGGRVRTLETTATRLVDPIAGAIGILVLRDVSEARATAAALDRLLHHDGPSGLPSRALLEQMLAALLEASARSGERVAVVVVSVRGVSDLEEVQGPEVAAETLRTLAARLARALRPGTAIGRVGTGELAFASRLSEPGRPVASLASIASSIAEAAAEAALGGADLRVGAALYPEHAAEPASLLRCAILAARQPPVQPGTVRLYAPAEDRRARRRLELVDALRRAIRTGTLEVVHQPKVDTWTGLPVGFEALVRWRDPVLGPVSPSEFVPLAEETDLIAPLTEIVLARALADHGRLQTRGLALPVAVNLSGRTLEQAGAGGSLLSLVDRLGGSPAALSFEVTETALIRSGPEATGAIECLREAGYGVALDDFGVGYSSFARLRDMPVSAVKIDRGLVRVMPDDRSGALVLASVLELAEKLGLETVGEGVEEPADLERLRVLGCTFAQGYQIAPPMPVAELADWLVAKLPRSDRPPGRAGPAGSVAGEPAPAARGASRAAEPALYEPRTRAHAGGPRAAIEGAVGLRG